MIQSIRHEGEILSVELVRLLRQVDPAAFRDEHESEVRARRDAVALRLESLLAQLEDHGSDGRLATIRERMRVVLRAMEAFSPRAPGPSLAEWTSFQRAVQPAYESLAASLRAFAVPAASVRPTNYKRNAFHVASGLVAWTVLQVLPGQGWVAAVAGTFALTGWTLETARRRSERVNRVLMRLLGPIAHPHEHHRVNSATWFTTALFVIALLFSRSACSVAVVVLALGDPVAAIVGRRFGKTKLRDGRSLEGMLAFFAAASLAAIAALAVTTPLPGQALIVLAAGGAAAGAVAELVSGKVDDNLTIPVAVAAAVTALGAALGV